MLAVAVTLAARSAATQPDPARSTDGGGGANNPPKNQSTGIAVTFEASAASLPQDDIRAAVARELEHQPADGTAVQGVLAIAVEENHVVARFRSPAGYTERVLPLPEERAQIAVMLGLLAGNLARDQRAAMRPEPAAPAVVEPAVTPVRDRPVPPRPHTKPTPPYPRHFVGLHVAQDFMPVSASSPCDPLRVQANDHFACYYAGTGEPYFHSTEPNSDTIDGTLTVATTRVLFSYEYAVAPWLTLGLRAGYAFRGGPPAGKAPNPDGTSTGGTPFMPWHAELRGSYWFTPLTKRAALHGFAGVSFGLAQVDAKVHHELVDCEVFASGLDPESQMTGLEECRQGLHPDAPANTKLDAWKKTGQGFVGAHGGAMLSISETLAATLDMTILGMFPAYGVSFQPSVGMVLTP